MEKGATVLATVGVTAVVVCGAETAVVIPAAGPFLLRERG